MFVRAKKRFEDGKEHRYWSVVENVRNPNGRVVQRQVLCLGEVGDSQRAAWCRTIEVLCGGLDRSRWRCFRRPVSTGLVLPKSAEVKVPTSG